MIGTTCCATRGGGGGILHIEDYTGRLPASSPGLFPQKMGGATHFLREKPWGRGWKAPPKRDTFLKVQVYIGKGRDFTS